MAPLQRASRGKAFRKVLGFTFQHWRRQPLRAASTAAMTLLATLAEALSPLYAGRLVDAVAQGSGGDATFWTLALWAFWSMAGLYLVSIILRTAVYFNIIALTLRIMNDIITDAFQRVQRFSTDWHANSFAGSTVRKITRGSGAIDLLNDTLLLNLLPSTVMLVGATVILGLNWPVMGAVVGIGSLIYVGVTVFLSVAWVAPAGALANAWDTRMGGALADAVSCNGVVKAFGAETREEARLTGVVGKWRKRTRRVWQRGTLNGGAQGVMMVGMQSAILGTALLLWRQGAATPGDIAFVLTMFFVLQGHLRDVGQYIRNLQRSVNDMEELVDLYSQPLGIEDRPGARPIAIGRGAIAFDDVTFQYGAHVTPLYRHLSVAIAPGERVGLVGHSGSGKTTFIKLIQRLYDIKAGHITIDGQDIAAVQQAALRNQIAIVQQEPILFHRTLAENIAYAMPGATLLQIQEAALQANAHAFIMDLPKGYETLVGERGVKLSGGERQRVAIARAFLADCPILIMDEATSSLDSESEVLIQQAMERLMDGRTTLVIAHRLSTVRALDRLLVFDKGRIVEEGTHEDLIRITGGIYRRLFERQALELTKGLRTA